MRLVGNSGCSWPSRGSQAAVGAWALHSSGARRALRCGATARLTPLRARASTPRGPRPLPAQGGRARVKPLRACAAQVWQAVLTKPIDLDSSRMRQEMSDGARSLLKARARPAAHPGRPRRAAACSPGGAWRPVRSAVQALRLPSRRRGAAGAPLRRGSPRSMLPGLSAPARAGALPGGLCPALGVDDEGVMVRTAAARAGPAGPGRGPAPDGHAGAGARLGAPGRHRARPAAGRHRGARPAAYAASPGACARRECMLRETLHVPGQGRS